MPAHETATFSQQFIILDNVIERFKESLPPLEQIRFNMGYAIRQMVIIHTLTHAATIQLHNVFAPVSTTSRQKCLVAANDIVTITNNVTHRDYTHINPVASVSVPSFPLFLTILILMPTTVFVDSCVPGVD